MDSTTFAPAAAASNNSLTDRLTPEEFERLRHLSRPVEIEARQTLYAPGDRVAHAYFPDGAVAATVAAMDDGSTAETSMIGREGVVGVGAAVGEIRARHWTRVLLPGVALRVEAGALGEILEESPSWRGMFLRYYGVLMGQVSRRAICNARHRLSERFSTWFLMVRDRASDGEFPLTQETIARQLGVRRSGVTVAVGVVERAGLITHGRGKIVVKNAEGLRGVSCECVKIMAEEYEDFVNEQTV